MPDLFRNKFTFLTVSIAMTVGHLWAQKQVTGKVVDAQSRKPITNAIVQTKGDNKQITSNAAGYFQIVVDSLEVIRVSAQGYERGYATLTNFANVQIALEPSIRPFEKLPFAVDPKMLAISRGIFKEAGASNAFDVLQYPHSLVRDGWEAESLKKNKVKLIRSKNFMHQYDERGLLVHEEYYKDTDFGIQWREKGLKAIIRRNAYGYEVTKELTKKGDVWFSRCYYSGDTVFTAKFLRLKAAPAVTLPDVIYVSYGNMDVIYDCSTQDFDLIFYKVTASDDGYLIESLRDYLDKEKKTELDHAMRLTKDYHLKEESLEGIQYRYSYSALGILTNAEVHKNDKLLRKVSFKRNERGLVTEHQLDRFRGNGKLKSSNTIQYAYEYYD